MINENELIKSEENLTKVETNTLARIRGNVLGETRLLYPGKDAMIPDTSKKIVIKECRAPDAIIEYSSSREEGFMVHLRTIADSIKSTFKGRMNIDVRYRPIIDDALVKLGAHQDSDISVLMKFYPLPRDILFEFGDYSSNKYSDNINGTLQARLQTLKNAHGSIAIQYLDELFTYIVERGFFATRFAIDANKNVIGLEFNYKDRLSKISLSPMENLKKVVSGEKTMLEGKEKLMMGGQEAKRLYGARVVLPPKIPRVPKQLTGRTPEQLTEGDLGKNLPAEIKRYVISVTVEPPSVTMRIGDSQRFTARVIDHNGKELDDVSVSWSTNASVGTLNRLYFPNQMRCIFRAERAGNTDIIATANGISGKAIVTVTSDQQPAPQPQPVVPTVTSTTPPVMPRPPFTKYFFLKLPNILLILIGMSLFGMEQASYGGGNYQFNYTTFVGGGVILSIFAIFASYFVSDTNQQNPQQQGGGGTP